MFNWVNLVLKESWVGRNFWKTANLGLFLFVGVLVANQRGGVYLSYWIFDYKNGTSIQSCCNRNECIYDFYKDSIIWWPINHEKTFKPLGRATALTKSESNAYEKYEEITWPPMGELWFPILIMLIRLIKGWDTSYANAIKNPKDARITTIY